MERIIAIALKQGTSVLTSSGARRWSDIPCRGDYVKGFVTESGTFLNEQEAYLQALRAGQIVAKDRAVLEPEDIRGEQR